MMEKAWNFIDGKKRGIAIVLAALMGWAWQYKVMPEQWLSLGNVVVDLLGAGAILHAVAKKKAAVAVEQAE